MTPMSVVEARVSSNFSDKTNKTIFEKLFIDEIGIAIIVSLCTICLI